MSDNINLQRSSKTDVLIQYGNEVMRCRGEKDTISCAYLLDLFSKNAKRTEGADFR